MEDYEKKYKEALGRANAKIETYNHLGNASVVKSICEIFPELKESEDERIRKSIIDLVEKQMPKSENKKWMIAWLEKQGEKVDVIKNFNTEFERQISHLIASTINKEHEYNEGFVKWVANALLNYAKHELEKKDGSNYPYQPGWRKNYSGNKPKVKHSVLMLTTHGIGEGEWLGEEWCQYRWSCKVKDTEVLYWMHLSDLENLEKENEKQGEQKPTDNLEPKFKVGDWVVRNCKNNDTVIHKVVNIRLINDNCEIYGYELDDFTYVSGSFENEYRLWTIQDAKDGDVLATDNGSICIFDGTVEEGKYPFAYCGVTERGFEFYDGKLPFTHTNVQPATKEQCELLFTKMKEACYEWDVEKKELKKIEQKPTWSEEDERYYDSALWHIKNSCGIEGNVYNWLKSLKERYIWKSSDEQIEVLYKYAEQNNHDGSVLTSLYQDLKKLKGE